MAEWHDINSPGFFFKPKPKPEDQGPKKRNTGIDDDQPKAKEPPPVEYRFLSVRAMEPAQGFEQNKPYDIEGEVEQIRKITQSRVLLYPIGKYKGQEDQFVPGGVEAFIDTSTLKFKGTCKYLFDPEPYARDDAKPSDATWDLVIRAEGNTAEKPFESSPQTFPKPTKFQTLRKGDYDDNGADSNKKPKEGANYMSGTSVTDLQKSLEKVGCYFGNCTGYFGERTEAALKSFQAYAAKSTRYRKSDKDPEDASAVLAGYTDGIYDKPTANELKIWLDKGYQPYPTIRQGEVDDSGVNNGKGECDSDDHHKGTVVTDAQKNLEALGATPGKQDGWFYEKMKAAVDLFLDAAEKGKFLVNGVMTDVGETLKNPRKGQLTPAAMVYLERRVKEGAKVAGETTTVDGLTDSVGLEGANKPVDVKKVKSRLKELAYPVNDESEQITSDDIKAIKFFQIAYTKIETVEDTANPQMVRFPDGLISKGMATERNLFGSSAKKYDLPIKGSKKMIADDCQKKINSAKEADKVKWDKIAKVWAAVSQYLPSGSSMTSGYRSADEQRTLLYNFYNIKYKDRIIKKFTKSEWQKYYDLEGSNNADADAEILQMVRACGQKIAAPGTSPHQKGIAIDIGGTGDEKQCRALLWCYVYQPDGITITKVLPEVNGCVHFEFKP